MEASFRLSPRLTEVRQIRTLSCAVFDMAHPRLVRHATVSIPLRRARAARGPAIDTYADAPPSVPTRNLVPGVGMTAVGSLRRSSRCIQSIPKEMPLREKGLPDLPVEGAPLCSPPPTRMGGKLRPGPVTAPPSIAARAEGRGGFVVSVGSLCCIAHMSCCVVDTMWICLPACRGDLGFIDKYEGRGPVVTRASRREVPRGTNVGMIVGRRTRLSRAGSVGCIEDIALKDAPARS